MGASLLTLREKEAKPVCLRSSGALLGRGKGHTCGHNLVFQCHLVVTLETVTHDFLLGKEKSKQKKNLIILTTENYKFVLWALP